MSESESEDEILDRIEAALRKIAGHAGGPVLAGGNGVGDTLNREAVAGRLDEIIGRLRAALEPLRPEAGE